MFLESEDELLLNILYMKVVIITHFSNSLVRACLPISRLKLDNWIRAIVGQKSNRFDKDFAPWITVLINELRKKKNLELHVIAPYMGLRNDICEFCKEGVHYHFFNCSLSSYYLESLMLVLKKDFMILKYKKNRKIIKKLVRDIRPDIINLYGAENPYYACSVLDINDVPIISSCQTVYSNPQRIKSEPVSKRRWEMEEQIFKHVKYFGVSCDLYDQLVKKVNPHALTFFHRFPAMDIPEIEERIKEFDFVNFAANHCDKKGSFDSILALNIVKQKYPNVILNIAGGCAPSVKNEMLQLIERFELQNNVVFTDYFSQHIDLLNHVKKAWYAVLPVKLDVISGTILQAMKLGLPVVTNITSGTPSLNLKEQCVLLAEPNNIQDLADKMIQLLDSSILANELKKNAREYYNAYSDNEAIVDRLVQIYQVIIDHHCYNRAIPKQFLFKY